MSCFNLRGEEDLYFIINFFIKFLIRYKLYIIMLVDIFVFLILLFVMYVYLFEFFVVSCLSLRMFKVVVGLWIIIIFGVEKILCLFFCYLKICGLVDKFVVKEV